MTTAQTIIDETHESNQSNRLMQALLIAAIAASSLSMIFSIGTAVVSAAGQPTSTVAIDH